MERICNRYDEGTCSIALSLCFTLKENYRKVVSGVKTAAEFKNDHFEDRTKEDALKDIRFRLDCLGRSEVFIPTGMTAVHEYAFCIGKIEVEE